MSAPTASARAVTNDHIREVAATHGVCVRPVLRKVIDQQTGQTHKLVIPCGSTREYLCPTCATKAQRLRMQQCEEGWHLDEETLPDPDQPNDDPDHNAGDGRDQ